MGLKLNVDELGYDYGKTTSERSEWEMKTKKKLLKLIETYKDKVIPTLPIDASTLMTKYNIAEGKILGNKLKLIEEIWVQNSFQISEKQIQKIIKS